HRALHSFPTRRSSDLNAQLVAQLDVLLNFAVIAGRNHYVRPTVDLSNAIDIKGGRHPVIEQHLPVDEDYITNDVFLDNDTQQIIDRKSTRLNSSHVKI